MGLREEMEMNRISCWKLQKNIENLIWKIKEYGYFKDPKDAEMALNYCEELFLQKKIANILRETHKLDFAFIGAKAAFGHLNLSSSERKKKVKYFIQIIEESLSICEGYDGPETDAKKDL